MSKILHAFIAAAALAAASALPGQALAQAQAPAQAASGMPDAAQFQDAMAFFDSVALPKESVACSDRLDGFAARFQPIYDRWRSANAAAIDRGEVVVRKKAAASGHSFEDEVAAVTKRPLDKLASVKEAAGKQLCEDILRGLNAQAAVR